MLGWPAVSTHSQSSDRTSSTFCLSAAPTGSELVEHGQDVLIKPQLAARRLLSRPGGVFQFSIEPSRLVRLHGLKAKTATPAPVETVRALDVPVAVLLARDEGPNVSATAGRTSEISRDGH